MQETELSIIHIPLELYQLYLPVILQLLFPSGELHETKAQHHTTKYANGDEPWANRHSFLNVSVNSLEASIVCSKHLATQSFLPMLDHAAKAGGIESGDYGSISTDDYVAISVEGAGMEAGQRVLEVTSPLAIARVGVLFITTYFSDYILVPAGAKSQVIQALEDRGFAFEKGSKSYVNPSSHHRNGSSSSGPTSPPASPLTTMTQLQIRTFSLLRKHGIVPKLDRGVRLVQCAARSENPETFIADDLAFQHGLTKCLIHQPGFLSVTMTRDKSASLLIEKRLVSNFDMTSDWESVLLGDKNDILTPISLDLGMLDIQASGIVCGVASRLVQGPGVLQPIDMSYLSTARAGWLMVNENDTDDAMSYLQADRTDSHPGQDD